MKRETQQRPGIGKSALTSLSDPRPVKPKQQALPAGGVVTTSVTLSARYIDSRLKQFCCR